MLVDCDSCVARGPACGDCVIGVVLGAPPGPMELDEPQRRALDVLADAGMVPRLQLIPGGAGDPVSAGGPIPVGDQIPVPLFAASSARRGRPRMSA
jgi:hypothetical protein